MKTPQKIKIISCIRSDYWYKTLIGETFEIVEGNFGINQHKVIRHPVEKYGENWFVNSMDTMSVK